MRTSTTEALIPCESSLSEYFARPAIETRRLTITPLETPFLSRIRFIFTGTTSSCCKKGPAPAFPGPPRLPRAHTRSRRSARRKRLRRAPPRTTPLRRALHGVLTVFLAPRQRSTRRDGRAPRSLLRRIARPALPRARLPLTAQAPLLLLPIRCMARPPALRLAIRQAV